MSSLKLLSFADRFLLRTADHRVGLCRLVEQVFRDAGLEWTEIAVVRSQDRTRYACLVAMPATSMVIERIEYAAMRVSCLAWDRLRIELKFRDFYWRVGESGEQVGECRHASA